MNRVIKVALLLLGVVFIVLQGFAYKAEGDAIGTLMLVLLIVMYLKWTEDKNRYFIGFLILFSIGHLLDFYSWYGPAIDEGNIDYYYYGVNILSILSYVFLTIRFASKLKFKKVFAELAIPMVILIILDIFCVVLVTDTTKGALLSAHEYALEFIYNAIIMTLLSVALITYMYRNDNKSMLFLIGSICIVFSEIIQLAYYYIVVDDKELGFIYAFFLVVAFVFFYLQSQLPFTGPQPSYSEERLEV
ncbi:hypothetical protein [Winogradskyella flava]|uniref:YhhN-like protein n=1 Tax=Winogradskyella flava TaxID=1884876 RepID=A0A842IQJ5_9FLAO|nr:hypothetical protein [Winogradskyella flava]MBC2845482.1 hypothetical protein [Winogradskyella flava]